MEEEEEEEGPFATHVQSQQQEELGGVFFFALLPASKPKVVRSGLGRTPFDIGVFANTFAYSFFGYLLGGGCGPGHPCWFFFASFPCGPARRGKETAKKTGEEEEEEGKIVAKVFLSLSLFSRWAKRQLWTNCAGNTKQDTFLLLLSLSVFFFFLVCRYAKRGGEKWKQIRSCTTGDTHRYVY